MEKNSVYDLDSQIFNKKLAEALKSVPEFEMPEWAKFVKTGVARARPPAESDFWFKRAAAILRAAYLKKIVGVNRLRNKFGGRKNRGMKPEKFKKASGKIIRTILQQAEKAGLMEKIKAKRTGRQLTDRGRKLLEGIK